MANRYRVTRMYPNGSLRITNGSPGVEIVVGFLGYVTHYSTEGLACVVADSGNFRSENDGRGTRHVFTGRLEGTYKVPGRSGR